jgi:hypothetical protein
MQTQKDEREGYSDGDRKLSDVQRKCFISFGVFRPGFFVGCRSFSPQQEARRWMRRCVSPALALNRLLRVTGCCIRELRRDGAFFRAYATFVERR